MTHGRQDFIYNKEEQKGPKKQICASVILKFHFEIATNTCENSVWTFSFIQQGLHVCPLITSISQMEFPLSSHAKTKRIHTHA